MIVTRLPHPDVAATRPDVTAGLPAVCSFFDCAHCGGTRRLYSPPVSRHTCSLDGMIAARGDTPALDTYPVTHNAVWFARSTRVVAAL